MVEITSKANQIKILAPKSTLMEITSPQGNLDLGIEKDTDVNGIGMGVLSNGTPYLNQRGLAALCGVQNAHIGTISAQWRDAEERPRITAIKAILNKLGVEPPVAHYEIMAKGKVNYCYPADVCLAVLEYYAFDAGPNCQPQARDNFRILAGSKLRELIYSQVGYDPTGQHRFDKWHERIALNYQSAPKGHFHVFNECNTIIYELIMAGAEIGEKFVADISVGQHWSKFWDDNELSEAYGGRGKYPHRYPETHPQSKSNPQESWCYPVESLGEFRRWLQEDYLEGGKFKTYLSNKVSQHQLAPSFAELAIATLAGPSALPAP